MKPNNGQVGRDRFHGPLPRTASKPGPAMSAASSAIPAAMPKTVAACSGSGYVLMPLGDGRLRPSPTPGVSSSACIATAGERGQRRLAERGQRRLAEERSCSETRLAEERSCGETETEGWCCDGTTRAADGARRAAHSRIRMSVGTLRRQGSGAVVEFSGGCKERTRRLLKAFANGVAPSTVL